MSEEVAADAAEPVVAGSEKNGAVGSVVGNETVAKKETFQWSTPADEFADDVASDIEEESGDEAGNDVDGEAMADNSREVYLYSEVANGKVESKHEPPQLSGGKKAKSKNQFPCPKCNKVWNWPWELRRHLVMHFKEKERQDASAYKCDECGKGFQWKRDLSQHKRLHTGEKLLICSVCGKKFTTRQALLHHVVVHTGEKPFQCAQCGNRFTQPANLRTHMKKKHSNANVKGNKCIHCGESFPSVIAVHQHILDDHQQIVAEERELQSLEKLKKEQERAERELLREENRRKREEKRKERVVLNDFRPKGIKEWEMNYEFHLGDGLVRGVDWDRTPSSGELPCNECDRKFGWRYEIMFHGLCHMTDDEGNPKNRVCPECDTVFKVPIGLKHHLLLHTGELPFLCLHCWRSFSSHIDLKLHIRREHLFHLDMPTPASKKSIVVDGVKKKDEANRELKEEVVMVQQQQQQQAGQSVQFVVENEDGSSSEPQTIVLGSDAATSLTATDANGQDMIVVIQSDDYDQSQGLIVVDPAQLQRMVESGQLPASVSIEAGREAAMTIVGDATAANEDDATAIEAEAAADGDEGEGHQYISLQMPDGSSQTGTLVLASEDGEHAISADGNSYIVVGQDSDSKVGYQLVTACDEKAPEAKADPEQAEGRQAEPSNE